MYVLIRLADIGFIRLAATRYQQHCCKDHRYCPDKLHMLASFKSFCR
jgi:hypothetical protein